jgi:ubiquinone/menaquinone biosynthesis C-methylase UbiE
MNNSLPSWEAMYADEKFSWFWPPAYKPDSDPPELESILSLLDAQPGARILDLACGLGWLTIPLALRGFQVTGLDLSTALLTRTKQAAEQAGAAIEWVHGDIRHLPDEWTDSFDLVTFTLSEFGCFDEQFDNQKVLNEVARVLQGNGRFLLDIVVNRDGLVNQGDTVNYLEGDGFFVVQEWSLDLLSGIHKRVFRWYDQGQLQETQWQIQTYTAPEVKQMLEQAGFQVLGAYSSLSGKALSRDSDSMTFLAQKKING